MFKSYEAHPFSGFTVLLSTLTIVLSACSPAVDRSAKLELQDQQPPSIIGGKPVSSEDLVARSTVALYWLTSDWKVDVFCSGTLVTSRHVITAAHCIVNAAMELGVSPDEFMMNVYVGFGPQVETSFKSSETRFIPLHQVYVHPDYREKIESLDIPDLAVIELAATAPAGYQPVPIANDWYLRKDQKITVAGYGLVRKGLFIQAPNRLQKIDLKIANPDFSRTHFSLRFNLTDGVCSGDSGGPVYVEVAPGQLALLGVISWSSRGCLFKGAYVSLPKFRGWLKNILGARFIEYRDPSMLRRLKELFC